MATNDSQPNPTNSNNVPAPANVASDRPKRKITKEQIWGIGIGAAVIAAAIGIGVYAYVNRDTGVTTTIDSSSELTTSTDGAKEIALVDGETEIKAGGTYLVTGNVNGQLEVNTDQEVKLILNGVSITNANGAAIKLKGAGKVTIELRGENTLKSSESGDDPSATISANADLEITGTGSVNITGTGKGIKTDGLLTLTNGTYAVETSDDTIHSNGNITIAGGTYNLSSGDDGIHADGALTINDGKITISKSTEGLEAVTIKINGGDINLVASDDGINAPNSNGSTMMGVSGDGSLEITGGNIYVNANGDGLDSNGSITISGGTIYVDGPTSNGDGAIDCDGEIKITGGTLIAVGSSGMAQNATSASQPSVLVNLSGSYSGTLSFGGIEYTPKKSYQSVLISSPNLKVGETYELKINGSTVQSVTISQNVTGQGNGMMGGGMMGGQPNGQGGQGGQMPDRQQGAMGGRMR